MHAPALDTVALLPEIVLSALIGIVLVLDLVFNDARKRWLTCIAAAGVSISLGATVALMIGGRHASMISGSYVIDDFSLLAKALLLCGAFVVLLMGAPQTWKGEYIVLLLSSLLGMVMVVSSRDLITFFVAFELLAIPSYMLVGWNKNSTYGHEAALKYYLLGVISTAVMLYGLSLLFGVAGTTSFTGIAGTLANGGAEVPLARLGVFFVIVALGFKVSAVPFHFWAPDAYQGAPIPVAAFLSVASKAAGLLALVALIAVAFPGADSVWAPLIYVVAIATMTVGNLVALRQTDIVRLLAYSSIAQAGYMLVPLAVAGRYGGSMSLAVQSIFEFLVIYAVMNLGAFSVVIAVARRTGSTAVDSFNGLFYSSPALAVTFTVFLLSLAGIPPMGGWFAKFVIVRAGIEAKSAASIALLVVVAINTAIGLAYYATVIRHMWLKPSAVPADIEIAPVTLARTSRSIAIVLAIMTAGVVVSGIVPGVVTYLGGMSSLGQ